MDGAITDGVAGGYVKYEFDTEGLTIWARHAPCGVSSIYLFIQSPWTGIPRILGVVTPSATRWCPSRHLNKDAVGSQYPVSGSYPGTCHATG